MQRYLRTLQSSGFGGFSFALLSAPFLLVDVGPYIGPWVELSFTDRGPLLKSLFLLFIYFFNFGELCVDIAHTFLKKSQKCFAVPRLCLDLKF